MANPALNEKTFAPERLRTLAPEVAYETARTAESWRNRMTLEGVIIRCGMLAPILLATAWLGWNATDRVDGVVRIPGWLLPAVLVGLGLALVTVFKPKLARFTSPAYAAVEGFVVGAISAVYNSQFDGIVLQAVMLTGAVFAIMLGLYASRTIRVTDKLRKGVVAATLAVMAVYLVTFVLRIFGVDMPMIHDNGAVGILFSLAVVGIAAFNLMLDFDFIEKGVAAGAPKWMEWYAAFGLMVTLVWLYLELLRLLSKQRER